MAEMRSGSTFDRRRDTTVLPGTPFSRLAKTDHTVCRWHCRPSHVRRLPGAGKTWTAWAATGVFLMDHNETYYHNHDYHGNHFFTNWYAINQAARDSRVFGDTGEANREWVNRLAVCELLVIDEFATARPYEAEFMGVMSVIHSRFDNGSPTILITTKSDQESWASVGEAMVSRINSGIVVRMQGRDRRLPT